jgi:hypothetical protein
MILVFALLCAAGTSPAECTKANAIDIVQLPDATNELMCLRTGMFAVAPLAIQPGHGEYWKFVCSRESQPAAIANSDGRQTDTHGDAGARTGVGIPGSGQLP